MYYHGGNHFDGVYCSPTSLKWNPELVLGLVNHSKGRITCIGFAKTAGRRCRRDIAEVKVNGAEYILRQLAMESASRAAVSLELQTAAREMLCWQHKKDLLDELAKWRSYLNRWASEHEKESPSSTDTESDVDADNGTNAWYPEYTFDGLQNHLYEILREYQKMEEERAKRAEAGRRCKMEEQRRQEEQKRKEEQERKRKEEEEKEKERRRREEQRRWYEYEQKRREEEERRWQEELKRQEEEWKRRQEESRERAFRERVRLAKEERERKEREKVQKEAEEWRSSWDRYSSAWSNGTHMIPGSIPWPVKSGQRSDVNETNIKLFFAKAPPEPLVDSGEKRYKFINAENMRWHTDKVMQRFGQDVVYGPSRTALNTVAKVMIELRQEAQKTRRT
ncbi:hypothetical protein F5Y11DRAFT_317866 [Daldinia sp. FL1419]|nr:hypothetical protein F5Y11DRAFT_317866 [Daldinia sp. FL1419]